MLVLYLRGFALIEAVNYIDYYINILIELLNLDKNYDININIDKLSKNIYVESVKTDDYDGLCELNDNIGKSADLLSQFFSGSTESEGSEESEVSEEAEEECVVAR